MPILLTGFNAFDGLQANPSQQVVKAIAARQRFPQVITAVLPTEFAAAGEQIQMLIYQHQPQAVISLGVARTRSAINLERIAINLDDATIPDNAGVQPQGRSIVPGASLAYRSTLPLESMLDALNQHNIPAIISNHAGTYVCNHIFFTALHLVETQQMNIPCGFIHLPPIADQPPGLPLLTMTEAVECCLWVICQRDF